VNSGRSPFDRLGAAERRRSSGAAASRCSWPSGLSPRGGLLSARRPFRWRRPPTWCRCPRASIELRTRAYADTRLDTPSVLDVLSNFKQLAFLCRQVGFWTRIPNLAIPATVSFTGTYLQGRPVPLPEKLALTIGSFHLAGNENPSSGFDGHIEELDRRLEPVRRFFARTGDVGHDRLAAAMEWHFDAINIEDQTMAFLAGCIGMEAVYGDANDSERSAITQRLTDRYSYHMGTSSGSRRQLLSQYRKILETRGKLVHARASRLERDQRTQLTDLRLILERSIARELREFVGLAPV
jgi:hypothetical protein